MLELSGGLQRRRQQGAGLGQEALRCLPLRALDLSLPARGDIAKDEYHTDETPLSVTNRRGAIIDGVFHAVPGHEQRMIGEPYHRPFPNNFGDWTLNDLPGVLADNRKHRRDVLAQGFSFCPSSERYRYGIQKRHAPQAVGRDDGIPNTRQSNVQLFTLLV